MFGEMFGRLRLNLELSQREQGSYPDAAERKALRQARKAERAFRISKGYEKKKFWER